MPEDLISGRPPRSTQYRRRDPVRRSPRKTPDPLAPEARRLLTALESAIEAEPHAAELVRYVVERNAHGHVDDYHARDGLVVYDPPWVLRAARALVAALGRV